MIGIVITLVSGLLINIMMMWTMVGGSWWGYPLAWMSRSFGGPGMYGPLLFNWLNLVIDIVIWSFIIFVISSFVIRKKLLKKEEH